MGIRCLLISANTVTAPYAVHPLGIAQLAASLSLRGHSVVQYDVLVAGGLDGLNAVMAKSRPDLVGVSLRNVDTVDSANPQFFLEGAVELVRRIRAITAAPIVLGGSAFSLFPDALMARIDADYGITGEGEAALVDLADAISAGTPPPSGQVFHGGPQPMSHGAAYDPAIAAFYAARGGMLNLQTKRGCPFRCAYCAYPQLEGRRFRFRDPDAVADDAARLVDEQGCRYLFFTDAVFNDRQGYYLQVAEALLRRGNRTPWCAYFRPSDLGRAELSLLKKSGLHAMEFGTDAACDTTLAAMHKTFQFDDALATQRLCAELDIPTAHFFIFGGPGEDARTLEEGLANIDRLGRCVVFAFSGIRVLPGAPIEQRAIAEGVLDPDRDLLEPWFYFSPLIDQAAIARRLEAAWAGRADRVFPVADSQRQTGAMHKAGFTGPLWDMLLS